MLLVARPRCCVHKATTTTCLLPLQQQRRCCPNTTYNRRRRLRRREASCTTTSLHRRLARCAAGEGSYGGPCSAHGGLSYAFRYRQHPKFHQDTAIHCCCRPSGLDCRRIFSLQRKRGGYVGRAERGPRLLWVEIIACDHGKAYPYRITQQVQYGH